MIFLKNEICKGCYITLITDTDETFQGRVEEINELNIKIDISEPGSSAQAEGLVTKDETEIINWINIKSITVSP